MSVPPINKPPVVHSDSPTLDAMGLESQAGIPDQIDLGRNLDNDVDPKHTRPVTGVSFQPKTVPLPPLKTTSHKLDTQEKIRADHEAIRTQAKEQQAASEKMMRMMNADFSRTEFMERMLTLLYSAGLLAGAVVLTLATGGGGAILLVVAGGSFTMSAIDAGMSFKDWRNRANGKEGFTHRGDSLAELINVMQKRFGVEDSQKREKYADRISLGIRLVVAPFTAVHTAPYAKHPENLERNIDPVRLQEIRKNVHDKLHGRDIELSDHETLRPQGPKSSDGVQDDWFAREERKLSDDFNSRLQNLRRFADDKKAQKERADEAQREADTIEQHRLAEEAAAEQELMDEFMDEEDFGEYDLVTNQSAKKTLEAEKLKAEGKSVPTSRVSSRRSSIVSRS
ncbi:hypothetical protein D5R81_03095 [Parashewanella spongiae]|uniref:Uncharacterized protein n=2 Tax=Parashewanella spongiae TaxID=342950 RepID=A0A3A6TS38_9GAMM|nr:hypothetical protein D5R81_03095 [Parashewanella spongiae]